jgi:hypothetical protein
MGKANAGPGMRAGYQRQRLEIWVYVFNATLAGGFLRHSGMNLTMPRYSRGLRGQESEVSGTLPDLSVLPQERQRATGTDDANATENVLAPSLAHQCEKQRFQANGCEQKRTGDTENVNSAKQAVKCKKPVLRGHRSTLPKEGVEPSPCCQDGILNPARLPIPPLRRLLPFANCCRSRSSQ